MCCAVICWLTVSSRDCFTGTSFTAVNFVKLAMPAVKVAMVKVTANTTPVLCRIFHRRGWYVVLFKVGRSRCCTVIWWFWQSLVAVVQALLLPWSVSLNWPCRRSKSQWLKLRQMPPRSSAGSSTAGVGMRCCSRWDDPGVALSSGGFSSLLWLWYRRRFFDRGQFFQLVKPAVEVARVKVTAKSQGYGPAPAVMDISWICMGSYGRTCGSSSGSFSSGRCSSRCSSNQSSRVHGGLRGCRVSLGLIGQVGKSRKNEL